MTEKTVMGKAERLGFRLTKSIYGGYAIVDKDNRIVASKDSWMGISLEAANTWLNNYFQS